MPQVDLPPLTNKLHSYPSYVYSLSWHLLSEEEYNNIVITAQYSPQNVMIASAGRYSPDFPRNEFFSEDFYFENLSMTTIIMPNDYSRNTNAIDINYTIIEPYGFSLVERILKAAEAVNSKNYLDQPYLLQIDFFAFDDAGNLVGRIDNLTKRIPMKLNKMDIKITNRGAEYHINATPFCHSAFEATTVSTPANFEITASSVKDFFQSDEGTSGDTFNQALKLLDTNQRETKEKEKKEKTPNALTDTSYGSAINAYQLALAVKEKQSIPDVYRFEFMPDPETGDDVFASAVFTEKNTNTPKDSPMVKNSTQAGPITMRRANTGENQNTYDLTKSIFAINYGTTIEKLLEYVIRNSSYIQNQLVIPDGLTSEEYKARKEALKDKPLNWFKITPVVRLIGYDKIRKSFAREISYVVTPYKIYNIRSAIGPQGTAIYPVKNYNYIYSGQNDDVLDMEITFNALYYTQQTAYRDNLAEVNPSASSDNEENRDQNAGNYNGSNSAGDASGANDVAPTKEKPVVQNAKEAQGNPANAKDVAAGDLADSLMTNSQADMLAVKLKIIGDPDYIKQDDLFYNGLNTPDMKGEDPRLVKDGSLLTDDGGLYVQVLFKVPTDMDEETGFAKFDSVARHSVFSGMYSVLQVTSTFSSGQFVQELDLIRLPRQTAFDYVGNNAPSTDERVTVSDEVVSIQQASNTDASGFIGSGRPVIAGLGQGSGEPDATTDQTEGQKQKVAQLEEEKPLATTKEQQDLKAIKDTAPTASINDQNEPAPTAPKPDVTPQGGSASLANRTVLDIDGFTTTFNSAGYPILRVAPDGSSTTFDSLGNADKKLINNSYV